MKKLKQKGFTLIELIVVIAILGILAMIAIPRLAGFQGSAKAKADIATGKTIATSVSTLIANQNITLPASGTLGLVVLNDAVVGADPGTSTATPVATNTGGSVTIGTYLKSYLQSVPKTGAGGTDWSITISNTGDVNVYAGTVSTSTKVFPQ